MEQNAGAAFEYMSSLCPWGGVSHMWVLGWCALVPIDMGQPMLHYMWQPTCGEKGADHYMCTSLQEYTSKNYSVLYYRNTCSIGLRRKTGGKEQIYSFGGKKYKRAEKVLRGFADECLRKLDAGVSEGEVKRWADSQVQAAD